MSSTYRPPKVPSGLIKFQHTLSDLLMIAAVAATSHPPDDVLAWVNDRNCEALRKREPLNELFLAAMDETPAVTPVTWSPGSLPIQFLPGLNVAWSKGNIPGPVRDDEYTYTPLGDIQCVVRDDYFPKLDIEGWTIYCMARHDGRDDTCLATVASPARDAMFRAVMEGISTIEQLAAADTGLPEAASSRLHHSLARTIVEDTYKDILEPHLNSDFFTESTVWHLWAVVPPVALHGPGLDGVVLVRYGERLLYALRNLVLHEKEIDPTIEYEVVRALYTALWHSGRVEDTIYTLRQGQQLDAVDAAIAACTGHDGPEWEELHDRRADVLDATEHMWAGSDRLAHATVATGWSPHQVLRMMAQEFTVNVQQHGSSFDRLVCRLLSIIFADDIVDDWPQARGSFKDWCAATGRTFPSTEVVTSLTPADLRCLVATARACEYGVALVRRFTAVFGQSTEQALKLHSVVFRAVVANPMTWPIVAKDGPTSTALEDCMGLVAHGVEARVYTRAAFVSRYGGRLNPGAIEALWPIIGRRACVWDTIDADPTTRGILACMDEWTKEDSIAVTELARAAWKATFNIVFSAYRDDLRDLIYANPTIKGNQAMWETVKEAISSSFYSQDIAEAIPVVVNWHRQYEMRFDTDFTPWEAIIYRATMHDPTHNTWAILKADRVLQTIAEAPPPHPEGTACRVAKRVTEVLEAHWIRFTRRHPGVSRAVYHVLCLREAEWETILGDRAVMEAKGDAAQGRAAYDALGVHDSFAGRFKDCLPSLEAREHVFRHVRDIPDMWGVIARDTALHGLCRDPPPGTLPPALALVGKVRLSVRSQLIDAAIVGVKDSFRMASVDPTRPTRDVIEDTVEGIAAAVRVAVSHNPVLVARLALEVPRVDRAILDAISTRLDLTIEAARDVLGRVGAACPAAGRVAAELLWDKPRAVEAILGEGPIREVLRKDVVTRKERDGLVDMISSKIKELDL